MLRCLHSVVSVYASEISERIEATPGEACESLVNIVPILKGNSLICTMDMMFPL